MKMPPADWDRYANAVHSRAQQNPTAPVGDSRRWGARSAFTATVAANSVRAFDLAQFLRVQADDVYTRSWTLIGTLRAPSAMWAFSNADPIAPAAPAWWASLVIIQGVGQTSVTQRIDLRALTTLTLAAGYRTIYDDDIHSGGAIVGGFESRPFRLVGSLVGNTVNVSVNHLIVTDANPLPASELITFAELSPLAAGEGL
jgi:hypothetical protein